MSWFLICVFSKHFYFNLGKTIPIELKILHFSMNDCSNHHSCSIRLIYVTSLQSASTKLYFGNLMNSREAISLCNSYDDSAIRDWESALSFCREERERRLAESRKGLLRHSIEMENRVSTFVSSTFVAFVIRTEESKEKEKPLEIAGDKDRHLALASRESENRGAKR